MDEDNLSEKIIGELAEYLGVPKEDISLDDSLYQDLHMRPDDIYDFIHTLESKGANISDVDLDKIEFVYDLFNLFESRGKA